MENGCAYSIFITSSAARTFRHLLLLSLVSAGAFATDEDLQQKKLEFLLQPVFNANQEKLTGKPKKGNSKEAARPTIKDKAQFLNSPSSAPAQVFTPPPAPAAPVASSGRLMPPPDSPSEKGKPAAQGTCGRNDFLGSFCFHRKGPNEWLLCTEKWGECTKRDESGCLSADTLVRLADGSQRRASSLRAGDRLWDAGLHQPLRIAKIVVGPERYPLVEIRTADNTLRVTRSHPVLTARGWVMARQLLPWDRVATETGGLAALRGLTETAVPTEPVINFQFVEERDPRFVPQLSTETLVTGALRLQQTLEAEAVP